MIVREILQIKGNTLFTTTPGQALTRAIETMAEVDVGALAVMAGGRMIGLLTFREVLVAISARGGKIEGVSVGEAMLTEPVTVPPEMKTNDLRRLMVEKRSRYVPVMDGDTLLGVVSFLDVARAVLEGQEFENKMLKTYIKHWPEETAGG